MYKNHLFAVRGFPGNARARDPTFLLILHLTQIKKCMVVCVLMLFSSRFRTQRDAAALLPRGRRSLLNLLVHSILAAP